MKCTRFEFDGVGIFHNIDMLMACDMTQPDREDLQYVINEFDATLQIPDIVEKAKTLSYFTENGLKAFRNELDILYRLFDEYCGNAGLGEIEEFDVDIPEDKIVYQDEYQVVIKKEKINDKN